MDRCLNECEREPSEVSECRDDIVEVLTLLLCVVNQLSSIFDWL